MSLRTAPATPTAPEQGEQVHVLLSGIVGSTAYGLAGPQSDIDRLGVIAAPTTALVGLHPPRESHVTTKPDRTLHEARKFALLCIGGNPTAFELLWLPDDLYEVRTALGDELIDLRSVFLSARRVRDAYLGYASQQFRRLTERGDGSFSADLRKRTAKHARHLARLTHQGVHLYTTGHLKIRVADPQWYHDFGDAVAAGDITIARNLLAEARQQMDEATSPLPARVDPEPVVAWLLRVRRAYWNPAAQP
ncbi:nucleotidyltransferase domain-containing protein [Micromonospora sp. DT227]|uniref:nucleotidyltransferase domain-containing protein n=1 Tax=Micromonospora sp. DT227 TaxID=3393433 RepID=UPI003CFAA0D1